MPRQKHTQGNFENWCPVKAKKEAKIFQPVGETIVVLLDHFNDVISADPSERHGYFEVR